MYISGDAIKIHESEFSRTPLADPNNRTDRTEIPFGPDYSDTVDE